jgi:hypothetical protein
LASMETEYKLAFSQAACHFFSMSEKEYCADIKVAGAKIQ